MNENLSATSSPKIIDRILEEIKDFESNSFPLTDRVSFSQYTTLQEIMTHKNKGFLKALADGQEDTRRFYDIISPMVETGQVNTDLNTDDFDPFVINEQDQAAAFIAKSLLKHFFKQTNHGEQINNIVEAFIDEGNVVVRKAGKGDGRIYRKVNLQNLYVIDQSAETLEDTTVIEKVILNQTQLRKLKELKNVNEVIQYANVSEKGKLPYYELFYRYGEVLRDELSELKTLVGEQADSEDYDKENDYVQALVVFARKRKGSKDFNLTNPDSSKGVILLAEELKPEKVKLSDSLEIEFYKPYREGHLGSYNGRWLRLGYREIGIPYQNTANEIGNQLKAVMEQLKFLYRSKDVKMLGRNILQSVDDGDIIICDDLEVLNNIFPNLSIFIERWNSNIQEAQRALKAFEVATGEKLASSVSATAVAIQNNAVGQFYNYKRQKLGLFFSLVFTSWVIPILIKQTSTQEKIEIIGDQSYMDDYISAMAKGWFIKERFKAEVLAGNELDKQGAEQLIELKKAELRKNKKQFLELEKDFFKGVEMFVDVNITGENINKQNRITNGLTLLQYLSNPMMMAQPETRDLVVEIANSLGFRIKLQPTPVNTMMMPEMMPVASTGGVSEQGQALKANQPQLTQ